MAQEQQTTVQEVLKLPVVPVQVVVALQVRMAQGATVHSTAAAVAAAGMAAVVHIRAAAVVVLLILQVPVCPVLLPLLRSVQEMDML